MFTLNRRTRSLYSRTFSLLLVGIDSALWIAIYILVSSFSLLELHTVLWIVSSLEWVAIVQLANDYQPESVRGSQQAYQTLLSALFHSLSLLVLCILAGWLPYIASILYVSIGFYLLRVITLYTLHSTYSSWKLHSDSVTRFITIGQYYSCQPIASHLLLGNAKHLGHISLESNTEDLLVKIEQMCVAHKVNHIYCTIPLTNLKALQQLADRHFMYLHWSPARELYEENLCKNYLINTQIAR